MPMPQYRVEIAFNAGYSTAAASRVWTDVSAYVEPSELSIKRGRQDERSTPGPSALDGLVLNNSDGRFTPESTASPYYPNVKKGRPIRVVAVHNGADSVRFTGYVDEWLPSWPEAVDVYATVDITASSRMARLGRGGEMRSIIEEETLPLAPDLLFLMNEPEGATAANDSAGRIVPAPRLAPGSGETAPTFGSATGPGTDGHTAAVFDAAADALEARISGILNTGTFCASMFLRSPSGGSLLWGQRILEVAAGFASNAYLFWDTTGAIAYEMTGMGSSVIGTKNVADGATHHVALIYEGGQSKIVVDGVVDVTFDRAPHSVNVLPRLRLNPALNGTSVTLAHVALWYGIRFGDTSVLSSASAGRISQSGLTGFAGEGSGARFARYAGYAGVSAAEAAGDGGSSHIAHIDTTGRTPIELMEQVAQTENGIVFDARGGILTFKGRSARYNVASAFTLDAALQEVEAGVTPRLDDQFLLNDVTVTDTSGVAARVKDQDSIDEYGYYRDSIDAVTANSADAQAGAEWRVGLNAEPRLRWDRIEVDVTNSTTSQATAVLAAEIGTRFAVTNPPSQAPTSSLDLFVEGYTETLSPTGHRIAFDTSPTTGYAGTNGVWQLDVNSLDGPAILAY